MLFLARLDSVYDLVYATDAEDRIDLRQFFEDAVPIPFGKASRYYDSLESVMFFQPRGLFLLECFHFHFYPPPTPFHSIDLSSTSPPQGSLP